MIRVREVRAGYGRGAVLKGVTLRARAGEITTVLGPNGSGKTTLLRVIAGLLRPEAGGVELMRRPISSFKGRERARLLAFVPQQPQREFPFRVDYYVLLGRFARLRPFADFDAEDRKKAEEALALLGLEGLRDRFLTELSGGEFRLAALARALAQGTRALVLDEPTEGLDPAHSILVFDLLRRLKEEGRAVLAVLHDINLAALYSDRLVFLKEGRVALEGRPEEVLRPGLLEGIYHAGFAHTNHPVTRAPQIHLVPGRE